MSSPYHLDTLVPTFVIIFALIYDTCSTFQSACPKPLKRLWQRVTSPLQNFLTPSDFDEPVGNPLPKPVLKIKVLFSLGILQSASWLGYFVYTSVKQDTNAMIRALLVSITWVRDLELPV